MHNAAWACMFAGFPACRRKEYGVRTFRTASMIDITGHFGQATRRLILARAYAGMCALMLIASPAVMPGMGFTGSRGLPVNEEEKGAPVEKEECRSASSVLAAESSIAHSASKRRRDPLNILNCLVGGIRQSSSGSAERLSRRFSASPLSGYPADAPNIPLRT